MSVGRNDPCSCGSGKKYKKCCYKKDKDKKINAKVLTGKVPNIFDRVHQKMMDLPSLADRKVKKLAEGEMLHAKKEEEAEKPSGEASQED